MRDNGSGYRSGFVSIIGRPNVGKSTLLNQIIGQKVAIMSDKPQTTRNKIRGVYTTDRFQIIFIDTPGIHKPKHRLGEYMVEVALRALREVEVVLHVVDATEELGGGEQYILRTLKEIETPVFLVINKSDQVEASRIDQIAAEYCRYYDFAEVVPISALYGDNVPRLLELVAEYLPEGPQYYPPEMVTDQPERFVVAEIIREKVLHLTREEVPHSVAVEIEQLEERKEGLVYIGAVIYTERESQKGILIGKGGRMLKEIGQAAREEVENLLGSKVFLDLWVKVKKDWRRDEIALRNFGYDKRRI
ncbi:GTPase Era [Calderihabitans maritimus]|uniref:GTPase Era n=1 Tax=Calderihabitans maritimus TaxID=1246530 RepID=A0A1Z5HV73_9FIRM|nr:GTPase Era [Calderihabitans maritimus]GAW93433.1 GTP-binding protein Era-like-protein [Calderihabitans maritimus]